MEIMDQDWKLFRQRLPGWQEAYMDRLNREYAKILAGEGIPSGKFWTLDKRIREDKRSPGVQLQPKRSELTYTLLLLITDGVITLDDLDGFSDNVTQPLKAFLHMQSESAKEITNGNI